MVKPHLDKDTLKVVGNFVPAGLVVIEKENGNVSYANQRAVELFGFNPVGLNFKDYAIDMAKARNLESGLYLYEQLPLVKALLYGKTTHNEEITIQRPRQAELTLLANAMPLTDQDGNTIGALALFEDITDRKNAEETLKASEQLYRTLFENTEDGFELFKPLYNKEGQPQDLLVLKVNEAYERQTGLPASNVVGKKVRESTPNVEPYWISTIGNVAKTGKAVRVENYNQSTHRWYDLSAFPYARDKVGVLFRDITERKKAEETLKENAERLMMAQQVGHVGTFEWNIQTGVNKWTPQLEALYGLPPGGFPGTEEAWEELVYYEDRAKMIALVNQAMDKGGFEAEWRVVWPDKSIHWIFGRSWVFKNSTGKPQRLIGINIDITERKKAEEALRKSEERLRTLVAASWDVVYQMNPDWTEMRFLQGQAFIPDTTEPSRTWLDRYIYPEDQAHVWSVIQRAIKTKGIFELEHRVRRVDGSVGWTLSRAIPILDKDDKIVEWLGTAKDITERKNLEKQLQDKERLAAIGQTAGMVGHDIRNPLQAITGDLYLIQQEINDNPTCTSAAITESIMAINENITYINKIVSDLQDYTKSLKQNLATINLKDIITKELAGREIPNNISVQVQAETNVELKTDPYFLRRILSNLLINAIQSMPDGGTLTIDSFKEDSKAFICIQDTGSGIPEEVKPNLFKPLFTTKAKGQGLGLAVVKRLVEALNGTISFESKVGKGTKFTIELPLA